MKVQVRFLPSDMVPSQITENDREIESLMCQQHINFEVGRRKRGWESQIQYVFEKVKGSINPVLYEFKETRQLERCEHFLRVSGRRCPREIFEGIYCWHHHNMDRAGRLEDGSTQRYIRIYKKGITS
jgi:hypothetical protein